MKQRLLLSVLFAATTSMFWCGAWAQDSKPGATEPAQEAEAERASSPGESTTSTPVETVSAAQPVGSTQVQLLRGEVEALSQWVKTTRMASQKNAVDDAERKKKKFKFSAFLRSRYGAVLQSDENPDFVGQNDGFRLDNARLQVDLKHKGFTGRFSIDGAVDQRDAENTSNGQLELGLRDGWVAWAASPFIRIGTGQFKPAFDGEELRSTRRMTFIERAVASRGIRGVEGWNVAGMSLQRELGLFLELKTPKSKGPQVISMVSLTNGSPASHPVNDNENLAVTARLEFKMGKRLTAGGGYRLNRITTGEAPDRLTDEVNAFAADLRFRQPVGPVTLLGSAQYMRRSVVSVDVPTEPETVGEGYHAAVGLRFLDGVEVAYRYATLDPTAEFVSDDPTIMAVLDADGVIHHTVGLNYAPDPKKQPFKIQLNYTTTVEDEGRTMDNDRLDVLFQLHFDERDKK